LHHTAFLSPPFKILATPVYGDKPPDLFFEDQRVLLFLNNLPC